jgi:hypothetical protein
MGNHGWLSRSFETHMHFSNLTCTNKKKKNTGKPSFELLTFTISTEWLRKHFNNKKGINKLCMKKM